MRDTRDTVVPEFKSLEEERAYWETRGPLAEGHKGRINRPKPGQKRSSFLVVRLTGEELTRLRDIAAKQGLGPSTFARIILTSAIRHEERLPKRITLDRLKQIVKDNLPREVKERADSLARDTAIGDPDNPVLLVIDASQMKESEELILSLFKALLSVAGVQVITPEDAGYQEVRDIVKAQT